jgi:D-alanyl-D-alanine carboxypeptidase
MRFSINDYSIRASDKGWGPGWPTDRFKDTAKVAADRSGVAVNVHKRIARLVDMLLDETEARDYLAKKEQTSAFCCRPIKDKHGQPTKTPSNHSWGLAIDLNSLDNPRSSDGIVHTKMPSWLPPLWGRYGFAWGGNYKHSLKDPMHLEFMGSPEDADDMTHKALADGIGNLPLNDADKRWLKAEIRDAVNEHANQLFRLEDHGGATATPSPPNHPHSHKAILDRLDDIEQRLL